MPVAPVPTSMKLLTTQGIGDENWRALPLHAATNQIIGMIRLRKSKVSYRIAFVVFEV